MGVHITRISLSYTHNNSIVPSIFITKDNYSISNSHGFMFIF